MTTPLRIDQYWSLAPDVDFLNHGSFGACPMTVMAAQDRFRARMEAEPVRFLWRELESQLDDVRVRLAALVGADPDDMAFVTNASTGVCTVLACLRFGPGDEVLTTNHVYPAVKYALERVLEPVGGRLVEAPVPFPLEGPAQVLEAVLAAVTPRTKLAVLDHITSPTALVFPIEDLVSALAERGIDTLVDGAHAPGQVPVAIDRIGAAYYTANCHKWLCAPKGAAFLHVRRDRQAAIHPLVTSHGARADRPGRSRFRLEFDWVGTADFSAYLAIPAALDLPRGFGGWEGWQAANHALVLEGRRILCDALGEPLPCPEAMVGSMASVVLPDAPPGSAGALQSNALQAALYDRHRIEVPVFEWPAWPARLLRISAQRYNRVEQYQHLARALAQELLEERARL